MKYNLVALAATQVFIFLVSADSIPQGTKHQDNWGNAVVVNECAHEAYYVYDNQPSRLTLSPSSTMSVPLYTKVADGGGGSIKLFADKNTDLYAKPAQPVTQFEFTPTDLQYFDISNVNSNIGGGVNGNGEPCLGFPPFMHGGMKLSAPGQSDVSCAPGDNPCKTAYSKNDDNFATTATKLGADIKLVLCPGGGSAGDSGSHGQGPAPPKAPVPQASSAPEAKPSQAPQIPPTEQKMAQKPQDAPPPAPSSPPPQQHDQQQKQPVEDVVWVTQVVTAAPHMETVVVGADGKPLQAGNMQKRHEHIHQHAHNKFNQRRHGA